ncbi:MAG: ABC transporter permease [Planctomycetes bacterium]|nr:ABC transporter permease [Planctomycetota bacterium]MCP4772225.1 ABC transporter permease [Planctomycetota bacterium]MCP4861281.1 ABC transporter permease [Planctomycetota bacterium]
MARLALSYLFKRPVQLLAVLGVAVGLMALLSVLAVMNGLIDMNRASIRGPLSDLLLIPAVTTELPRWKDYQTALADVDEIQAFAPHLVAYAMFSQDYAKVANKYSGIQIIGIDPELEMQVNDFGQNLADGKVIPIDGLEALKDPFSVGDDIFAPPGVVVSDDFMKLLGGFSDRRTPVMKLGSLPAILPPAGEELRPHNTEVQVAATYAGRDFRAALDRVYMRRTGRNSLHYDLLGSKAADFTEILIQLKEGVSHEQGKSAVLAALANAKLPSVGGDQGGSLQTWEERSGSLLSAIENERRIVTLVLFFIVVVAAFGLFTTISALVREKIRDLGVLAAIGFSPLRRGLLLLSTGAIASALGCVLGYAGASYLVANRVAIEDWVYGNFQVRVFDPNLYVVDSLPAQWDSEKALGLTLATFLVGILFTAVPAIRAALFSPVKALRYE